MVPSLGMASPPAPKARFRETVDGNGG